MIFLISGLMALAFGIGVIVGGLLESQTECQHDWSKWSELRQAEANFLWGAKVPCMLQIRSCRECNKTETRTVR